MSDENKTERADQIGADPLPPGITQTYRHPHTGKLVAGVDESGKLVHVDENARRQIDAGNAAKKSIEENEEHAE